VGIFGHLKASFNIIWQHKDPAKNGFFKLVKDNSVSFGIVIIIGVLFIVSLLLSATVTLVSTFFKDTLPYPQLLVQFLNQSISFSIIRRFWF
jgi:membrane protein